MQAARRWIGAARLEHAQLAFGVQGQPQRGWRGLAGGAQRAQGDAQAVAGLGRQLQPAQAAFVDAAACIRPAQHSRTAAGAQALFGGPQRLLRRGLDDDDGVELDPTLDQGRRIRSVRRCHQHDAAAAFAQACQQRQHQAEFALAVGGEQDLAHRRARPAAGGQKGIEFGQPTGLGGTLAARAAGAPQAGVGQ